MLTHFVTIKKNVTMSEASITWPTNFSTGPRPKLTKDKFDLTLCEYLFSIVVAASKNFLFSKWIHIKCIYISVATITQTRTVEKFSRWFHTQKIQPLVLVTTTNHPTYDANGPRSRNLLSDVSVPIDQKVKYIKNYDCRRITDGIRVLN